MEFDPTASSHFHVIEYVDVNAVCASVEIYSSQTTAWGDHTDVTFIDNQVCFLMVVCTLWGTLGVL